MKKRQQNASLLGSSLGDIDAGGSSQRQRQLATTSW
jgi:hypothetical protein